MKIAPDGGWGWVATFGVSVVNLATRSIEPSFGLLFDGLLTELEVGTTGAAIIISALDVVMNFSGLFVGPLLKEFSYRKIAIVGSLFCGFGLALTSPANSMIHILLTYSVINGIGVGLATSAAFVALNHYFKQKRGQSVGLSMAGTALGMLIMPQLVRILLEVYQFRGAVLILAGVSFNALVGSILLQPVKWHMKKDDIGFEMQSLPEINVIKEDDEDILPEMNHPSFVKQYIRKNFSEIAVSNCNKNEFSKRPTFSRIMSNNGISNYNSFTKMAISVRQRKISVISNLSQLDFTGSTVQVHLHIGDEELEKHDQVLKRINSYGGITDLNRDSFIKMNAVNVDKTDDKVTKGNKAEKIGFWERFADLMDIDLIRDLKFLNILFGLSIFYVAEMNFKMITPFFFSSLGYNKTDVAFCLSIAAVTDIAARIFLPPIFDRLKIKKRTIFLISIIFVAITRSIMAEQTEWFQLISWLSVCGFFRGSALSNFTLTVSEYCSLEKLPSAFGWHLVGKAVFVVVFGPLIGAIRDITGSFPICIHSQSICIFICNIAWSIELLIQFVQNKKKKVTIIAK